MSKSKGGVDNKKWEFIGDSLINLTIAENLHNLPHHINGMYAPHYLASNSCLRKISDRDDFPLKIREGSKQTLEYKGDKVEYYIAFLYINYGIDAAKRYIEKEIINKHKIK